MTVRGAQEQITEAVLAWEGVSAQAHRFGVTEYVIGKREIGHIHCDRWLDLTTFFDYPADIRRIVYTTNTVEAYHRQIRRVTKTKASFPLPEAARKLLHLATVDITRKWTVPIRNWPQALNQLAIRFEDRIDF